MKETILLIVLLLFAGCASQDQGNQPVTNETTKASVSTTKVSATTLSQASNGSDCELLWWFDNVSNEECRQDLYCGAYMYQGLQTYKTEAECNRSLPPKAPTTTILRLGLGAVCAENSDCDSRCCVHLSGKKTCMAKEECRRNLSETECLARNLYWCAAKCQTKPCDECSEYRRCVVVSQEGIEKAMVEQAEGYSGKSGSCRYNQRYTEAGGTGGYCDENEGSMIYAKCGSQATYEDCMKAYGEEKGTYAIQQKRSFESESGEKYDLRCFKCQRIA